MTERQPTEPEVINDWPAYKAMLIEQAVEREWAANEYRLSLAKPVPYNPPPDDRL